MRIIEKYFLLDGTLFVMKGVWGLRVRRRASKPKRHLICFCIAPLLVQCGSWSSLGSVLQELILSFRAHFLQFTHYLGGLKVRRSFLQLLCLLCVSSFFNNSHTSILVRMS